MLRKTSRLFPRQILSAVFLCVGICVGELQAADRQTISPREVVAAAISAVTPDAQRDLILSLKANPSPDNVEWLGKWRAGEIYLSPVNDGKTEAVLLSGSLDEKGTSAVVSLATGLPLTAEDGTPVRIKPGEVEAAETSSSIRKAMKEVTDISALADPLEAKRLRAVTDAAVGQNPDKLPALLALENTEKSPSVKRALRESISIIQLRSASATEQLAACDALGELGSIPAKDPLTTLLKEATTKNDAPLVEAVQSALRKIENHLAKINAVGTAFRGISLGSVLLVVAIGLAITFGLMGVINMAHGEFIALGAYATYVMQNFLTSGLKLSPLGFSLTIPGLHLARGEDLYFILALPASFVVAAVAGVFLERTVIRFLYRRPLESLLATWGVSLVMQQILKFIFGSNNVQVSSPSWLSGSWVINDVLLGWNRVFVIGFALALIGVTWLVLNKTSLGLVIRAVMQNRNMAACMGIRTERVNTVTFAFGCGLAGLAGAFLSQLANVGPTMGQLYIVDSFMTVVVGGVGNIWGTVVSALGIGMSDQSFQQYLGNPVIGKILVLGAIILFLQWRPAGLFVTRSRSLD